MADIFSVLLQKVVLDPKLQTVLLGLAVKLAVDFLKKKFAELDASRDAVGKKLLHVPVQFLVIVCSMLASLGDLYLKSQLVTVDPMTIVDFFTNTVPVYLDAMGIHIFSNMVKKKIDDKKGAAPNG